MDRLHTPSVFATWYEAWPDLAYWCLLPILSLNPLPPLFIDDLYSVVNPPAWQDHLNSFEISKPPINFKHLMNWHWKTKGWFFCWTRPLKPGEIQSIAWLRRWCRNCRNWAWPKPGRRWQGLTGHADVEHCGTKGVKILNFALLGLQESCSCSCSIHCCYRGKVFKSSNL